MILALLLPALEIFNDRLTCQQTKLQILEGQYPSIEARKTLAFAHVYCS